MAGFLLISATVITVVGVILLATGAALYSKYFSKLQSGVGSDEDRERLRITSDNWGKVAILGLIIALTGTIVLVGILQIMNFDVLVK